MRFVDFIVGKLVQGFNWIGNLLYKMFSFLAPVIGFLWELLQGIGYLIMQLALVVWGIIKLFGALIQFFGAIVVGFFRTIFSFMTIDYNAYPVNYPSTSYQGMAYVVQWLNLGGFLDVVPYIILALFWLLFAVSVIKLLGSGGSQ